MTDPGDIPREPFTFTTISFVVPKIAANALDVDAIAARAKTASLPRTRFEQSTVSVRPGTVRITCQRLLAPMIIEAFRDVALTASGELVIAAVAAATAGLEALGPRPR